MTASAMLLAAAFQPQKSPHNVAALARALDRLSAGMTPELAAPLANRPLVVRGQTTDLHVQAGVVRGVAALAERLGPNGNVPLEAGLAGRFLDAMNRTTDPHDLAEYGQAVAALAEPSSAAKAADKLLDAMRHTTDPIALGALGEAMVALAGRLSPDRGPQLVANAARRVLDVMTRTTDPNALANLGRTVDLLAERLTPERSAHVAASAAGPLLDALARQPSPGRELEALADRLTTRDLVTLLKHPSCVAEGRGILLRALGRRIGPTPPAKDVSAVLVAALQPCPLSAAILTSCGASLYPGGHRPFADVWDAVDYLRAHPLPGEPAASR
jgi:hypothetical protein